MSHFEHFYVVTKLLVYMLASAHQHIDDQIVAALSARPAQTASELFAKVCSPLQDKLTVQGWYKALRRLMAQEVLIKTGTTYSLNTRWILSAVRLIEQAERSHLVAPPLSPLRLPHGHQRITSHFNNLLQMDTFWGHMLVYVASQSKRPGVLYAYNPHFWYYLAHEQSEKEYSKGMGTFGVKTRMVIGSKSFLERWNAQFFDQSISHWLHPVPLYGSQCAAYNYLDGYFMEIKIAPQAAKKIEDLFSSVKSLDQISPLTLVSIFHAHNPCSINISKSKVRGEGLKRKVESYIRKSKG